MKEIPIPQKHEAFKISYKMGFDVGFEGREQLPAKFFSYHEQAVAYRDGFEAGKAARAEIQEDVAPPSGLRAPVVQRKKKCFFPWCGVDGKLCIDCSQ